MVRYFLDDHDRTEYPANLVQALCERGFIDTRNGLVASAPISGDRLGGLAATGIKREAGDDRSATDNANLFDGDYFQRRHNPLYDSDQDLSVIDGDRHDSMLTFDPRPSETGDSICTSARHHNGKRMTMSICFDGFVTLEVLKLFNFVSPNPQTLTRVLLVYQTMNVSGNCKFLVAQIFS